MDDAPDRPVDGLKTALIFIVPFALVLGSHAAYYLPFLSDDALISLQYVRRLLAGQGLTWSDGPRVEGYSNLLWILLISALGLLRVDLIMAARILGLLGMVAIGAALTFFVLARARQRTGWFALAVTLGFVGLSAPIAIWSIGGLEQPLYGGLIAGSVVLVCSYVGGGCTSSRTLRQLSLVLGCLCLTRPDGPLFAVTAGLTIFFARDGERRFAPRLLRLAMLAIGPVLCAGGQLAFRLLYYGELVPNSALIKLTPSWEHWRGGWTYLIGGLQAAAPFSWLGLGALMVLPFLRAGRPGIIYASLTAIAWSAYVVFIGGDIFPAYRHFVPLTVVIAFGLADALTIVTVPLVARRRTPPVATATLIAGMTLAVFGYRQLNDKYSERAMRERWEWDGKELALLLKAVFTPVQPLVAVTAAGCLPYWSELPVLDMLGLNDHYIARHPPAGIGRGFIGHEFGDGRYVLERRPDIIIFNIGSVPMFAAGDQLLAMPAFTERYVPVLVGTTPTNYFGTLYVDKYSPKIGIRASPGTISVPGFLLTSPHTIARMSTSGALAVELRHTEAVTLRFEAEPSVSWSVKVRTAPSSDAPTVISTVRREGTAVVLTLSSSSQRAIAVEEIILEAPARQ